MINKKEFFILSLTIFLTVIGWVIYDLLTIKYLPLSKENFNDIFTVEAKINPKIINLLKTREF